MNLKLLSLLGLSATLIFAERERTFGGAGLPDRLAAFDVNEDGVIDEEERQAIREARLKEHEERRDQRETRRNEIDTDGDGQISREELEAARDAHRSRMRETLEAKFAEWAGDDDCVDLDEYTAKIREVREEASEEMIQLLFARADSSGDGCISLDEFTARLRHHRKPGRDRPDPPQPPRPPERTR